MRPIHAVTAGQAAGGKQRGDELTDEPDDLRYPVEQRYHNEIPGRDDFWVPLSPAYFRWTNAEFDKHNAGHDNPKYRRSEPNPH